MYGQGCILNKVLSIDAEDRALSEIWVVRLMGGMRVKVEVDRRTFQTSPPHFLGYRQGCGLQVANDTHEQRMESRVRRLFPSAASKMRGRRSRVQ
jgi:hypothetical protein